MQERLDDLVLAAGCAPHIARKAKVIERRRAMHGTAIVPDDDIAVRPFVAIDELALGREVSQLLEKRAPFVERHADDV